MFLCLASQCAIGILRCLSMCLFSSETYLLVAYKWLDCSNEQFSTCERDEVFLVIRSAQYSRVGVAFRRFIKSWRNEIWEGLSPCCRKMVLSVTKVSNVCERAVPRDEPIVSPISRLNVYEKV